MLSKKLKIKFLDIYIKNYNSKILDNKLIKFIDDENINNYFIENNISTFDVKLLEYKYDKLGDIIDYSDIYDDNNLDELYNKTEDPNIAFYCIRRSLEKYNKNIKYLYYL